MSSHLNEPHFHDEKAAFAFKALGQVVGKRLTYRALGAKTKVAN